MLHYLLNNLALPLLGKINNILYRGNKFYCPTCHSNTSRFFPLPDCFRVEVEILGKTFTVHNYETLEIDHYMCPICRCSDRDRLYALYLATRQNSFQKKLIHFAP